MGMVADRDVSLEPLFWGWEGWGGLGIIVGFIAGESRSSGADLPRVWAQSGAASWTHNDRHSTIHKGKENHYYFPRFIFYFIGFKMSSLH